MQGPCGAAGWALRRFPPSGQGRQMRAPVGSVGQREALAILLRAAGVFVLLQFAAWGAVVVCPTRTLATCSVSGPVPARSPTFLPGGSVHCRIRVLRLSGLFVSREARQAALHRRARQCLPVGARLLRLLLRVCRWVTLKAHNIRRASLFGCFLVITRRVPSLPERRSARPCARLSTAFLQSIPTALCAMQFDRLTMIDRPGQCGPCFKWLSL